MRRYWCEVRKDLDSGRKIFIYPDELIDPEESRFKFSGVLADRNIAAMKDWGEGLNLVTVEVDEDGAEKLRKKIKNEISPYIAKRYPKEWEELTETILNEYHNAPLKYAATRWLIWGMQ